MNASITPITERHITLTMTETEARALHSLCLSDITIPRALAGDDRSTPEFVRAQGTVQTVAKALRPVLRELQR